MASKKYDFKLLYFEYESWYLHSNSHITLHEALVVSSVLKIFQCSLFIMKTVHQHSLSSMILELEENEFRQRKQKQNSVHRTVSIIHSLRHIHPFLTILFLIFLHKVIKIFFKELLKISKTFYWDEILVGNCSLLVS
jgi:L-lactate permease